MPPDTRNSQETAAALTLAPVGLEVTGWSATQHIDNATVNGKLLLSNGAELHTQSIVVAPATEATRGTTRFSRLLLKVADFRHFSSIVSLP